MGTQGGGPLMTSSLDLSLLNTAVLRWLDTLGQHGVFTTDRDLVIRTWNRWLEEHTGHLGTTVIGRHLFEAFPDLDARGFGGYYEGALGGQMKVLAHGLHRYVIPVLDIPEGEVRQSGRISPLELDSVVVGTITVVEDVT